MRINKKSDTRKIIIIAVAAALVLGGGVYAFREQLNLVPSEETTSTEQPTEQEAHEETIEQNNVPDSNNSGDDEAKDSPAPSDGGTTPDKQSATDVIISSINQDGNTMAIRTIIQPLVSGGECTLAMSKSGQDPVRQTAGVQNMPSYSTCQGFNVDVSGMAKGSWNVEITYTKDGLSKVGRGTAVVR